ncbi:MULTISPECIES: acetyltransferase [unclassified Sphingomonas]|jgi:putative acetyltransferase|uniref:acetyltransferase n=1 Tax=unclassified Sphingomonas TaxID=196159 RepID=UPI000A5DC0EF|nr:MULTISPECIES: acetyltransferase [unclassified Sphingomonas]
MAHIRPATEADVPRALAIWRAAVDATHGFLSPEHRAEIDAIVAEQFLPQAPLWLVEDDAGLVQGFLAMDGAMIDALFVDPAAHGRGFGTALIDHALALSPDALVDANEQADNALPFYLARGFEIIGRSESDPHGRPYPIIHLRYAG